ncbi:MULTISPECIES: RNA polymerase sigma factor [Reichenbachiella]|uniref:RNA polymerase sigma-70 factor, ECF subfamily n=1 Tax=Reichenbachiella agariperforans TaxID=156994 RepID=A0A1M6RIF6_REIAG|nr:MULTISPECIES: RNA polymerase sigma-70 factor [Reichenbachiella]MBU2915105.1 RNA polymerase sigma-70 factor [Reichenbachiella agariperforans]RJE70531.1 hypothetical protein BGP76_10615 [Reichenbachiella sp. MSK19-1]SHK32291.1 RNA polymerase sigma-70 factor, ECF subfamily [Reichenbachiella agariperforans]
MIFDTSSDANLIPALKKGDREAFEAIYAHFWKPLYIHVYKRLDDTYLAEEMVQEVFVQLWENRQKVEIERSLSAYLYGSVKNKILLHFRNLYRHSAHHAEIKYQAIKSDQQLERSVVQGDLLDKIEQLIQCLPNKSRRVFELSRVDFLSNKEIADRMGITDKTVEYHINYSLQYLRNHCPDYLLASLFFYTMTGAQA